MNPEMVIQELNSAIQKAEALLETMVAKSGGPAPTAEKRVLPEAKPLAAEMPHKPKGQGDSDEEVSDQAAVVVADKQGQKQDESDGHAKSDVGDLELTGQGKVVDGRVEAEGKAKIRLTDDLSLETLFKTDSKKSAFGGSVLFNAGSNASIATKAMFDTKGGHSLEAVMKLKGDGFELDSALGQSSKSGANASLDLLAKPIDHLEVGAGMKISEREGIMGTASVEYNPDPNVSIGGEVEVDSHGDVEGKVSLKIKF